MQTAVCNTDLQSCQVTSFAYNSNCILSLIFFISFFLQTYMPSGWGPCCVLNARLNAGNACFLRLLYAYLMSAVRWVYHNNNDVHSHTHIHQETSSRIHTHTRKVNANCHCKTVVEMTRAQCATHLSSNRTLHQIVSNWNRTGAAIFMPPASSVVIKTHTHKRSSIDIRCWGCPKMLLVQWIGSLSDAANVVRSLCAWQVRGQ